jgi:hypothetical protein
MNRSTVARAFVVFHLTLGAVVLFQSLRSVFGAAGIGTSAPPGWHVIALAGVEAMAAALFLFGRTLRVGGAVLMLTFAVAAVAHALRGEMPGALLVYAAGTAFVMVHGPVSRPRRLEVRAAESSA